ncbi:uncharacterized protein EV422DRAFT_501065 [Fimicolochytrium jonesii]|uniref:uncharacterized protein n=1 Tax=Fimicolochytrium jonesii TaxID=1396493 RepID=UPI0022FE836D|nr:uncharacterized protein EV422DRAFT_501065 [Fimicolochytrium jonesii]KAI8816564.1 hypothetical protein EV422DRAFT_501065 [Fimicolochytrium jonesii]
MLNASAVLSKPSLDILSREEVLPISNSQYSSDFAKSVYNLLSAFPPAADPIAILRPNIRQLPPGKAKRILVTGGAGFVGSHLVDALLLMGHSVIALDNFVTGNRENLAHWEGYKDFQLVDHDVALPFIADVDEIFHLACPASPPHYQRDPVFTINTCTTGTMNMLKLAKDTGARFLLASTSEVYGDPLEHPQKETYWGNVNPIGPRACYDEGKRIAETLTYAFAGSQNVDVRVVRIFNTFGPRMDPDDGRVVSNFIIQALRGTNITIYGDGSQTRSFQYVPDLVAGLIAVMGGNCVDPINLGNPHEYTVKQLGDMIRENINTKVGIRCLPAVVDDPQRRQPDITRARKEVGWQPRYLLQDGLQETIKYFAKKLAATQ